jgi:hypothetical protein
MTATPFSLKLSPPSVLARVARVRLKRRPGRAAWAGSMRAMRLAMSSSDWPASMSKSTPMRWSEAQRSRNAANPSSEAQVNEPAAPPVDRM